jgi:hypothetical protein
MLKEQAGNAVELLPRENRNYLEYKHCEIVRDISQTIQTSSLDKFTVLWVDALWRDLNAVVHRLQRLPEAAFKELIEVIAGLSEARNELRLARFLFDVEEINAVHRLVIRNRAVLRCQAILCKVLHVWPLLSRT